jgi:hypothetical protein
MSMFIAIKEESNFKHQYKIVFDVNRGYTLGRIRFEPFGPYGAGWNVRCSDEDQDLESLVRAKFAQHGRRFPMKRAIELFAEAQEELEIEYKAERSSWEKMMEMA